MSSKRSRVHPPYKTKYRVINWATYNKTLVDRVNLRLWISPDAIANWNAKPSERHRGGQPKYSNLAIETALTLRLVYHLPFRQTEGFVTSIFDLMGLHLDVPDHTTLSRRGKTLKIELKAKFHLGPIDLIIDSTGLSVFGEGQWAAAKHGSKGFQGWKKLPLGVDGAGIIVAEALTGPNVDDARTGARLIKNNRFRVKAVVGDAAYDSREIYETAEECGARVVVPPIKNARVDKHSPQARNRSVKRIAKIGRQRWKTEVGYHWQCKAENTFFRYKSMIGDRLRSRDPDSQKTEVILGCNILNRMFARGRPRSVAIRD
jgi:IS5 family transposase